MMDRMEKEPLIQEGRRLPDVADVDGLVSFMGRLTEEQESFILICCWLLWSVCTRL